MKQLIYSIFFLFVIQYFLQSSADAEVLDRGYYRDETIQDFITSGNFDDFQKFGEFEKGILLGQFLSGNFDDKKQLKAIKEKILNAYVYQGSDPALKSSAYSYGFALALESDRMAEANTIFFNRLNADPKAAKSYICDAIFEMVCSNRACGYRGNDDISQSEVDQEQIAANAEDIKKIIPFVAAGNLSNANCAKEIGRKGTLTILNILSEADPNFVNLLSKETKSEAHASGELSKQYLNCSPLQLSQLLFEPFASIKSAKVNASSYVIADSNQCHLNGLIRKTKTGYEYAPSNGIAGYMKTTIRFEQFKDLIAQLKKPATQPPAAAANINISTVKKLVPVTPGVRAAN